MQKILINVKTDKQIKKNAQSIAKELGLSLSDIINASLRNFIRTREVYISSIPRMTPEFERIIGRIETDLKKKKNVSKTFTSLKDMNTHLDSLRSL